MSTLSAGLRQHEAGVSEQFGAIMCTREPLMWGQRKCGGIVSHDFRQFSLTLDINIVPKRACLEAVWALRWEPLLREVDRNAPGGRKPPNNPA